jgi:hypothetical protein
MDKSHIMSALFRKYCHLMGELKRYPERSERVGRDMAHVEAAIRMFRPDADLTSLRPIKPNKGARWATRGFGIRNAIDILQSSPEPMTTRQIAHVIMERAGMSIDDKKLAAEVRSSIHMAMMRRVDQNIFRREGSPILWSVRLD